MKFKELISIRPPENTPTMPNRFMVVDRHAARIQCTTNSAGAMNRNVNSMGSVTPQTIAVSTMGISSAFSCVFFSFFAVG